jgi:hypothetical protein
MTITVEPPYLVDPFRRTERGFRETIKGVAPAAATDYAVTMDPRYVTVLTSVFCRLTTDANVASREVVLEYRTGEALRFALMGAPVSVSANDVSDYAFIRGLGQPDWPIDDSILVPLVPHPLVGSESFRLHIVSAQAADTLTLIRYTWERFYTDETR